MIEIVLVSEMDRFELGNRQRNLTLASRAVMEAAFGCKKNQKQISALRAEILRNLEKLKRAIELERALQCQKDKTSEKFHPAKCYPKQGHSTSSLSSMVQKQ